MRVCSRAFSRTDLLVVMGALGLLTLTGILVLKSHNTSIRKAYCAGNLRQLGVAFALYEKDNGERLPYAYVKHDMKHFKAWDLLVFDYLAKGAVNPTNQLRCPSDTIASATGEPEPRRSYSMAFHDMDAGDFLWPPGPQNTTGVGIWWEDGRKEMARLSASAGITDTNWVSTPLPAFHLGMIPSPAATLLLTEQARSNNVVFGWRWAAIRDPAMHVDRHFIQMNELHGGKFNYLMVDGHVEEMYPLQSVGQRDFREKETDANHRNVWIIRD